MEVQQTFHMNGGEGETSYANNSSYHRTRIQLLKPLVEKGVKGIISAADAPRRVGVADLGCASGPNALALVSIIIDAVHNECQLSGHPPPELVVHLNDLPGNDFNSVFKYLPAFYDGLNEGKVGRCFVFAVPGSFHGRLFPSKSMHVVCSSMSLHWLSQVPKEIGAAGRALNKGNLCVGKTSSSFVFKAYKQQYKRDFTSFLASRSKELVSGGLMILTLAGQATQDPSNEEYYDMWKPLQDSLNDMVARGLIDELKVDSFNMPYYAPYIEELRDLVQVEGSFDITLLEEIVFSKGNEAIDDDTNRLNTKAGARILRAISESLLINHFGEVATNELFLSLEKFLYKFSLESKSKGVYLVVSLVKRD